jgi:hypothetical protein
MKYPLTPAGLGVALKDPPRSSCAAQTPKGFDPAASGEGKPPQSEAKRLISAPVLLGSVDEAWAKRGTRPHQSLLLISRSDD